MQLPTILTILTVTGLKSTSNGRNETGGTFCFKMQTKSTGYVMDFSSSFRKAEKEKEKEETSIVIPKSSPSMCDWKLPTSNSLEENATYLNEQLSYLVSNLDFNDPTLRFTSTNESDIENIMQVIHYLLYLKRQDAMEIQNLTELVLKLQSEGKRTSNRLDIMTDKWNIEKQSSSELSNRLLAKEKAFSAEKQQFKLEKRDLEKKIRALQHVDTQYKATLRKNEQQYMRLQKQLTGILQKNTTGSKKQIVSSTTLNDKENCRRVALDTKDMTQLVVSSYETRAKELSDENERLHESLQLFNSDLKQLTSEFKSTVRLLFTKHPDIAMDSTFIPADSVEETMEMLRKKIEELKNVGSKSSSEDLNQIIVEQDKLLRLALERCDQRDPALDLSYVEMLADDLESERQSLASSRAHFEQERQLFITQATHLDQERVEFQM